MADHESSDLASAAYLAREGDPGDDRPSRAELAEEASSTALRFARLAKEEGRREVIAEVVEALREPGANWMGPDCARTDGDDFADFIEQRFAWTPTDHGYDEEAGW